MLALEYPNSTDVSSANPAVTSSSAVPAVVPTLSDDSSAAISDANPAVTVVYPVPYFSPMITSAVMPSASYITAASASGPSVNNMASNFSVEAPLNSETNNDLDAEISRLQQQMEVLKLRRELSNVNQHGFHFKIDISSIEAMIPVFTGDEHYDIKKWINDLEDAFVILQFDERAKLIGCRRRLDGTAKIFLRTVAAPSYEILKRLLIEEFGYVRTLQEVYEELKQRHRKPGESLKRYVLEMQEIASQSLIPETELVDLIICGINDNSSAGTMLYSASTIKGLKLQLERYERCCARNVKPSTTNRMSIAVSGSLPKNNLVRTTVPKPSNTNSVGETIRCFNCSRFGHYQSQCTFPKRPEGSCFKCGQTNHMYRDCPNRANRLAAAVEVTDVLNYTDNLQMP